MWVPFPPHEEKCPLLVPLTSGLAAPCRPEDTAVNETNELLPSRSQLAPEEREGMNTGYQDRVAEGGYIKN